jgi:hypothetical protein
MVPLDGLGLGGVRSSTCVTPEHVGGVLGCEHEGPHVPDGARLDAGGDRLPARHSRRRCKDAAPLEKSLNADDGEAAEHDQGDDDDDEEPSERVTGIEPALSAWEGPGRLHREQDLH